MSYLLDSLSSLFGYKTASKIIPYEGKRNFAEDVIGKEIFLYILSFLEFKDIRSLRTTEKRFREIIKFDLHRIHSTKKGGSQISLKAMRQCYPGIRSLQGISLMVNKPLDIDDIESLTHFDIYIINWELASFKGIIDRYLEKFFSQHSLPVNYRMIFRGCIYLKITPSKISMSQKVWGCKSSQDEGYRLPDIERLGSSIKHVVYTNPEGETVAEHINVNFPNVEKITFKEPSSIIYLSHPRDRLESIFPKLKSIKINCPKCRDVVPLSSSSIFLEAVISNTCRRKCSFHYAWGPVGPTGPTGCQGPIGLPGPVGLPGPTGCQG